jgi:RNA polymerase sigma-70 factor (ECF subfamily)
MPAAEEQRLIHDARNGDALAFRLLVEGHMKQAYGLAYRMLGDHDLAQDVAQEAFIRAHRKLPEFRGDAGFGTWLYRIVVNLALDRKSQDARRVDLNLAGHLEAAGPAPPDVMIAAENRIHLERALHELPTLQRAVVILRHLEGLSTRQVGAILGCSEGTVKTHLFRAMKKLHKRLVLLGTAAT